MMTTMTSTTRYGLATVQELQPTQILTALGPRKPHLRRQRHLLVLLLPMVRITFLFHPVFTLNLSNRRLLISSISFPPLRSTIASNARPTTQLCCIIPSLHRSTLRLQLPLIASIQRRVFPLHCTHVSRNAPASNSQSQWSQSNIGVSR
jgi:hypothetical protein